MLFLPRLSFAFCIWSALQATNFSRGYRILGTYSAAIGSWGGVERSEAMEIAVNTNIIVEQTRR